jgi:glycosyltransferase involved in cell wall biosynthesis
VRKGVKLWADQKDIDLYFGSLFRDSDRMIFLSERHLAEAAEKFSNVKGKSVVIPPPPLMRISPEENGATRKRARESLGLKPDDFLIAYFGYVDESKGVETLFKALQLIANHRKSAQLMMLGGGLGPSNDAPSQHSKTRVPFERAMEALNDLRQRSERVAGYERAIYAFPNELGIADKVTWKGGYESDSDEASVYLRAGDICVLPYDDGVTLNRSSFAAAAVHGLPIVTTRGPLLESAFVHQKNVILCPPKNPEALAVAIETLMADPALRGRLSSGARDLARKWFSWESAIKQTIGTFKPEAA